MRGAGLPVDLETGLRVLEGIVEEFGPHYNRHFDKLLERLGLRWNPGIIAAGVIAYRGDKRGLPEALSRHLSGPPEAEGVWIPSGEHLRGEVG